MSFLDLRFFIVGYDEDVKEKMQEVIECHGGRIVGKSFKGVADYAVVPVLGVPISQTASEVVTCYWLVSDFFMYIQWFKNANIVILFLVKIW